MLEEREREAKEAGEGLRQALLLGEGVEEECKVLRKRLQEAQGRIKGAQGDFEEAQDRAEGLERALQACKKSEGSAKEEVLSLKDEVGKLEGECRRMQAEVSVTKASLVERSKGEVAAKSLAERLGGELELERVSVQALEERLSNVGSQRSEFHARACRAEKGLDDERGEVMRLQKGLDDARGEAERLREEVMRLEGEVVGKGEAADRLEGEGRALRGELDALRGELTGARALLDGLAGERDALRGELASARDLLDGLTSERDALRGELASARDLLDVSRSQVADLGGRFEAFVARQTERGMDVAVRMIDRIRNLAVGRAFSGWRDKAMAQVRPKTFEILRAEPHLSRLETLNIAPGGGHRDVEGPKSSSTSHTSPNKPQTSNPKTPRPQIPKSQTPQIPNSKSWILRPRPRGKNPILEFQVTSPLHSCAGKSQGRLLKDRPPYEILRTVPRVGGFQREGIQGKTG
jgi:predicted  nucleic acid-binding Zn-ribbon protein